MLYLRAADVRDLLDLRQAMDCTREAFRQQAAGEALAHPPFSLSRGQGALRFTAGGLPGLGWTGIRVGMGRYGVQEPPFALLWDTEREELVCMMVYPFSTLRVGATVGVAVDLLSRRNATRVGLVGSGRGARVMLDGVRQVRDVERVRVYSRTAERREGFVDDMRARVSADIAAVDDPRAALEGADIVLVSTSSSTPVLKAEWLDAETHVSSAGRPSELHEDVYLRAQTVVVSIKAHEESYFDKSIDNVLPRLSREGRLDWSGLPELGDVLMGRVPSRQGISVFREAQGGFGDVALAAWAYEQAKRLGRGQEITLA
jgi:ornithine cyclodeaminase/alanine dehydrogenase-like protein (mu-crystallin family)